MSQTSWKDALITMANYKYPAELRERATRLAVEARRDPATRIGAIARIAKQTKVHKEALRNWVSNAEADDVPTPTFTMGVAWRRCPNTLSQAVRAVGSGVGAVVDGWS